MSGANTMVDVESAVRDYLMTDEVNQRIVGYSGSIIRVYLYEFNPDAPKTCLMVREAGGSGNVYLRLDNVMIQVWTRAEHPEIAKKLMLRVDDELHQLGPKQLNDEVFCHSMLRNTGKQRVDDPVTKLAQYFVTYNVICSRVD